MDEIAGREFGPYKIIAPLGAGGMAAVYRAYQPGMDRYVAIKVLPPAYALDAKFVERFRREARTIARLEHPHIVPVYDFGEASGSLYLVMRLFESGTLHDRLVQGPLSPAEIRKVMAQISDALDYAHSLKIIHRDLKPSNILIDRRGDCFLSDFGIAKLLEESAMTGSGGVLGTPQYVSPEQVLGQKIDHRADLYGLGVILYELVAGRLPFEGDTPLAMALKHAQEPPAPPTWSNAAIPAALEAVIMKSLAKNPDERYQSGQEMAAAIDNAFNSAASASAVGVSPVTPLETAPPAAVASPPQARPAAAFAAPAPISATLAPASGPATSPMPAAGGRGRRTLLLVAAAGTLALCGLIAAALLGWRFFGQPGPLFAPPVSPTEEVEDTGPLPFEDHFDDNRNGWELAEGQDVATAAVDEESGELVVKMTGAYGVAVAAAPNMPAVGDSIVTVQAYVAQGDDYKFGLGRRIQSDSPSGYVFLVRHSNLVRISRWDNWLETNFDEIPSDAFNTDDSEWISIQASCVGSEIRMSVNDTEVYSHSDTTYSSGYIMLFVESMNENPVEVHFDDLTVTAPE